MSGYQGAELSAEEASVLEEIEKLIGEPVRYDGPMPYGEEEVDYRSYGSNPDESYIYFGFRTYQDHVTELALNNKNLARLPESFGKLNWLQVVRLEKNRLGELPQSIAEIPELNCVLLSGNLLKSLPPGFTVQQGDAFGVFSDGGTNIDLRDNPVELRIFLVLLHLDHVALSHEYPDRIRLHQSKEMYDELFMLMPEELFLHPILQRLEFSSLKILDETCPHCHHPEVLTGELSATRQTLTFCANCEYEISVSLLSDEMQERLQTPLGKFEQECGIRLLRVNGIITSIYGYTGEPNHVTGMGFEKAQLEELPESLGEITTLEALSLGYSHFTRIPESIGNLVNLKKLYIWCAKMENLPESIGKLTNLETLELYDGQLTSLPESIDGLTSLRKLNLGRNRLTTLPDGIGGLTSLLELDLDRNQLSELPESFGNLAQLEELDLSDNRLTALPESIGNLRKLKKLNLSQNQLTTLPESFGLLTELQELHLSGNPLTGLPDSFMNLWNLSQSPLDSRFLADRPDLNQQMNKLLSTADFNDAKIIPKEAAALRTLQDTLGVHIKHGTQFGAPQSEFKVRNKQVVSLQLADSQVAEIPDCLGRFWRLEELSLHSLRQVTTLPDILCELMLLKELKMWQLMELASLPEQLGKLERLQKLEINWGKLTTLPKTISSLTHLRYAEMMGNQFTSLPEEITQWKSIVYLSFQCNPITTVPESLGNLSELAYLRLDRTEITSLPNSIRNLTNLKALFVNGSPLSRSAEEMARVVELLPRSCQIDPGMIEIRY